MAWPVGTAAVVDVETTGLSPYRDEIVELAIVVFTFDWQTGAVDAAAEEYVGLREPSVPVSEGAAAVNGITMEMVRGQALDEARVADLFGRADILVAHNAAFDRSFLVRAYPYLDGKPWLCTIRDIDWYARGVPGKSLQALLAFHGIAPEGAHRAAEDCHSAWRLLAFRGPDGSTYFREMLGRKGLLAGSEGGQRSASG